LTPKQWRKLERVAARRKAESGLVERVRIVLLAAQGATNLEISRRLGCTAKTAGKWRTRFAKSRRKKPAVLTDAPRSGRPTTIPHWVRLEVVKLACDRPVKHKQRFRDVWTLAALRTALERETGLSLSVSEIRRVLRTEQIRPHHIKLWLHSPDPDFRPKVRAICDEYLRPPGPGETVVCVDEKTGMQALEHKHPLEPPGVGRAGRREFEYVRHGTWTLFAAFNPHTGEVFGRCSKRRKYDDLMRFMEQLARHYPRGRVTVIWDNLNIHEEHRWAAFNRRHASRFRFLYTPLHASWVNQVEIWFAILARRVLKHGSFPTGLALQAAVIGFIGHWNRHEAHPFRWTFRGRFKRAA
jgi:transposase